MDKVTLIEAARLVDLHPNTVRNWRKSGKLKTAEKVLDNNVETWVVDPHEVHQLANQPKSTSGVNNRSYTVNVPDGQPTPEEVYQQSQSAITAAQEQTATFMRESVVRPLVEANERQAAVIGELREELGCLKEQLRQSNEQLEASQALRDAQATLITEEVDNRTTGANRPRTGPDGAGATAKRILGQDVWRIVTCQNFLLNRFHSMKSLVVIGG